MKPKAENCLEAIPSVPMFTQIEDAAWNEAEKRFEILHPLISRRCSKAEIRKASESIGLGVTMVYQLLKKLRADPKVDSLLESKPGRTPGAVPMHGAVGQVVQAVLDEVDSVEEDRTAASFIRLVQARCEVLKLKPPSDKKLRRVFDDKGAHQRLTEKRGKVIADHREGPKQQGRIVECPLDQFQIDHTKLDIILVDKITRREIGRPFLSVVTDSASRSLMGFLLTLDDPSSSTDAFLIARAIWPKTAYLNDLRIRGVEWPQYGKPKEIFTDNGADFRSSSFRRGCANAGIKLIFRRSVHSGGLVERIIGTINREVHELPGTTGSSARDRRDYDSQKMAFFGLDDLERWLIQRIHRYHQSIHRGLDQTPIDLWQSAVSSGQADPAASIRDLREHDFTIGFLPMVVRKCRKDGLHVHNQRFVGNITVSMLDRQVEVFYNPLDMRCVWVRIDAKQLHVASNIIPPDALTTLSFEEKRRQRKAMRQDHRAFGGSQKALQSVLNSEEISSDLRKERRRREAEGRRIHRNKLLVPPPATPKPHKQVQYGGALKALKVL